MINEIYLKMIDFFCGDAPRITHLTKVHSYGKLIAEKENVDKETRYILEIALLMHDIGIRVSERKFGMQNGKLQESEGPPVAEEILREMNLDETIISRVSYLIAHHHTYTNVDGIDYQILLEADFIVNFFEEDFSKEAIQNNINKYFKTETGKNICETMFLK